MALPAEHRPLWRPTPIDALKSWALCAGPPLIDPVPSGGGSGEGGGDGYGLKNRRCEELVDKAIRGIPGVSYLAVREILLRVYLDGVDPGLLRLVGPNEVWPFRPLGVLQSDVVGCLIMRVRGAVEKQIEGHDWASDPINLPSLA